MCQGMGKKKRKVSNLEAIVFGLSFSAILFNQLIESPMIFFPWLFNSSIFSFSFFFFSFFFFPLKKREKERWSEKERTEGSRTSRVMIGGFFTMADCHHNIGF